jgi:hypothetical protein
VPVNRQTVKTFHLAANINSEFGMQVIVVCEETVDPIVIEVPDDGDSDIFIQLVMAESGKNIQQYFLQVENRVIRPGFKLIDLGVSDGSVVNLVRSVSSNMPITQMSIFDVPHDITPEALLTVVASNPHLLSQYQHSDPELALCLSTNNLPNLRGLFMKRHMARHKQMFEQRRNIQTLDEDPMNPDVQKKIEEAVCFCLSLIIL